MNEQIIANVQYSWYYSPFWLVLLIQYGFFVEGKQLH